MSGWADEDRLWLEGTVNGKPVRFILDTGASQTATLFRQSAERLGLAITSLTSTNGGGNSNGVWTGYTEKCNVRIGDDSSKIWFWVVDSPVDDPFIGDGFIGWPAFTNCVVMIKAKFGLVVDFKRVPLDTSDWMRLPIDAGTNYLRLIVSKPDERKRVLAVYTGYPGGIRLRSDLWQEWKTSHTNQPLTVTANLNFGEGWVICEEGWAEQISFGPLSLTDVPVIEASAKERQTEGEDVEAALGVAALKRMDLIVDAIHGVAYVHERTEKSLPPRHSAPFVPSSVTNSQLVARINTNSLAYKAGIRDGDALLKVNGRTVSSLNDFVREVQWIGKQPAKTVIHLTLKRGEKIIEADVAVPDVLGP